MANESQLKPEENNRPKIHDIIPRKDRKSSLLAKIMGPYPSAPLAQKDSRSTFFRSLPFGYSGRAQHAKVIHLKKHSSPDVISLLPKQVSSQETAKRARLKKRILPKPLFLEETGKNTEEPVSDHRASSSLPRASLRRTVLFGLASAVVIFFLLSFVFARATVSLESSSAALSLEGVRIGAGAKVKEIDVAGKKIPGIFLEVPGSIKREFSSSAKERVSRKASGTVRIYNAFNSVPQTFVARTRFQDVFGRVFRLKQRITVPGAKIQNGAIVPSSISAAVEADKAGDEFNIGPSRFTIPGFVGTAKSSGFYAESSDPFMGGFIGDAPVVKQSDIDAASEEVTAELFLHLKEELERKIPSGATAIQGAREIVIIALRKPSAGEIRDRFAVEADGKASAMLFRMDDLFSLLEKLAVSPDAEKKVSQEKSHLEFDKISLSPKDRVVSFDVRGPLVVFSVLAPEEFQQSLSGKTERDAENILRADSRIRAFGIKPFPFWRNTIPSDERKIRILVKE